MSNPRILPGQTIGILGGGQLGRMLAMVAQRNGYKVHVMTPESNSPASSVAHRTFQNEYEDPAQIVGFARSVDVVTTEFENISAAALERASEYCHVRPNADCLRIAQNRIREKQTMSKLGIPVSPFIAIESLGDIDELEKSLGFPAVIKTASWGYDGKGQRIVHDMQQANEAVSLLGPDPLVAEKWVDFIAEVSMLVARNADGEIITYPIFENDHRNHILDVTRCPVRTELAGVEREAQQIGRELVEKIDYVGLLCVEFFVTQDKRVMVNEIAPRPHNSGHLTIEAFNVSQFEMQLRAVCNLPLGSVRLQQPAAMANLMGEIWADGGPCFDCIPNQPDTNLHLYGKQTPRQGRKMGHLTSLGVSSEIAVERVLAARSALAGSEPKLFS